MKEFKSVAIWDGENLPASTVDGHDTREAAEAVCKMLQNDGYGGEGKHFPVATVVLPIQENAMARVKNLTASFPCLDRDGKARVHDDGKIVMMNKVSVGHCKSIKSYLLEFATYEGRALTTTKIHISEKGAAALAMLLSHDSFRDNLIEGIKTLQEVK